ncbi:MAG: hypothetical protein KIY10_04400 [Thermoplasmata archaeon]|nr:hypothetical protein [Candidatus Sysuiplasma jiujiangense]MBX8641796.1 hypothetical protein [Candidatus Sysuiplasma jiujiangense]
MFSEAEQRAREFGCQG